MISFSPVKVPLAMALLSESESVLAAWLGLGASAPACGKLIVYDVMDDLVGADVSPDPFYLIRGRKDFHE